MHHSRGNDLQARLLEATIDFTDQILLHTVGFYD
jgi:hypothetical protein